MTGGYVDSKRGKHKGRKCHMSFQGNKEEKLVKGYS